MNILAIGNSFSHDATRYLHKIARSDGFDLQIVSLYIGGCSLERHFRNMMSEREVYELFYNGEMTGFYISLKEVLLNRQWDYITIQQASTLSGDYSSYQPYLDALCEYVRRYSPKAKLVVHQTWAYEEGCNALEKLGKYKNHKEMFSNIEESYQKAADAIGADFIIKSGKLMQMLLHEGIESVHRDGCHLSFGTGRYAAALLWYTMLTKNGVDENSFNDFDVPVSSKEVSIAKKCVKILAENG